MIRVAVFVPVLNRPQRVRPLLESLHASRPPGHLGLTVEPVFVASPGDTEELTALRREGVEPLVADFQPGKADYARKMNLAFRRTDHDFVFLGADDLRFHPGWLEAALALHLTSWACVVGTNDLGNSRVTEGFHSTHTLVCRAYGECGTVDEPELLLHEGYHHNFVDDEFVGTAAARLTYAKAHDSYVEHLHPHWRKAARDATYDLGQARFDEDRRYHTARRRLWEA